MFDGYSHFMRMLFGLSGQCNFKFINGTTQFYAILYFKESTKATFSEGKD